MYGHIQNKRTAKFEKFSGINRFVNDLDTSVCRYHITIISLRVGHN